MKIHNRCLRTALSLLLVLVLCLSLFPTGAFAEETDTADTEKNSGPAASSAYIALKLREQDSSYQYLYTSKNGTYDTVGEENACAYYDLDTNTLTLENFHAYRFEINKMGEDFKILLKGENNIDSDIKLWGDVWGCSAFFTGDGSLITGSSISIAAENSASVLTLDENVNIDCGKDISVYSSTAADPLVIKGRERSGGTVGHPKLTQSVAHWYYNLESNSYGDIYHNPAKPYSQYAQFENTEYFQISTSLSRVRRRSDMLEHDAVQFSIFAVDLDEQGRFILKQNLTSEYVWDDSFLYSMFKDDPTQMTISDYDPNYQYVEPEGVDESVYCVTDTSGKLMEGVEIVPQNSDIPNRPRISTLKLPDGLQKIPYSAKIDAETGNAGGKIVDFTIHGTAAKWLRIDSKGNLTGTPTSLGCYNATVVAIEETNNQKVSSIPKNIRLLIGPPDNYLTFDSVVNDGFMHIVTITNLGTNESRVFNLGKHDLAPSTIIDLSDLDEGSYSAVFTAEATGATVTYNNNIVDFTIAQGQKTKVVFSLSDPQVAYNDKSLFLTVNDFGLVSDLKSVTAQFTLSDGSVIERNVYKRVSVFPNVIDEGVTITDFRLTGEDDIGQNVNIMSGNPYIENNRAEVTVNEYGFQKYNVYGIPSALNDVVFRLSINGNSISYSPSDKIILRTLSDEDKTEYISQSGLSESQLLAYDFENAQFINSSGSLEIKLDSLKKNATLSGKITDESGNPLNGVSISYTQTVNGYNNSGSTVTNSQGEYTLKSLTADKKVILTATLSGFESLEQTVENVQKGSTCDLVMNKQSAVTVYTDIDIYKASFTWSGADSGSLNATAANSIFTLPLNRSGVNGNITVSMTSSSTTGTAKGTVKVKNGIGVLHLNVTQKGTIDWSGYDAQGNETENYSAYRVDIKGISSLPYGSTFANVDAGTYTVNIRDRLTDDLIVSQNVTVKSGEVSYLSVKIPDSAKAGSVNSATVTGPAEATAGETYKITGVITSIDNKMIESIGFFHDTTQYSGSCNYAVINGTKVVLANGWAYRNSNTGADWSLPLNFTAYFTQDASPESPVQNALVTMYTSDGKKVSNQILVGSVSTKYIPNLTLYTVSAIGATKTKDTEGVYYYQPDPVRFSGKAPANTEISLYDNDVLTAKVISDDKGRYEGKLSLRSSDAYHIIKAECSVSGSTATATSKCTYEPAGAVLTELYLNNNPLSLDGSKTAYSTTPIASVNFTAVFKNPKMLDDVTYTIGGKNVTDKVFFLLKTAGGPRVVQGEQISDIKWSSGKIYPGAEYILGVEVLYRTKIKDYTAKDTYTDTDGSQQTIDVEYAMKRKGVDALPDGSYNGTYDYKAFAKALIDDSKTIAGTGDGDQTDTEEDPDDLTQYTSNEIYRAVNEVYNTGDGPGRYETLTAQQAAEKCPEGKAEIRTYTDSPQYTFSSQNLKLRFDELKNKKYKVYSYVDEASGHKMFMFSGTFYYGADALPVPSVQIEKVYSGIKHLEDDPRLFYKGKVVGSKLEVVYICDVTGQKWYRSQTAYIPSKAKSPIHTSAWQIPSTFEAPFDYKDTNVFHVTASTSGMAQTGADMSISKTGEPLISGFKFSIDFSKVSAKTYTSGVISLGGYGASKIMSSTYVFDKAKMVKLDSRTLKIMNATDEMIDFANYEGKNIFYVGVTQESIYGAGVVYTLSELNNEYGKGSKTVDDAYKTIETQLRDNMRYWGAVKTAANKVNADNNGGIIGDFSYDKVRADRMIERTRKMADSLTELQKTIEDAQNQNEFTSGVTEKTSYVSLFASLVPGVGSETSLVLDACCFLLNAANDTNNEKVKAACEKFMEDYKAYVATDQEYKEEIKKDEENIKLHQKQGSSVKSRSDCADGKDFSDDPIDASILGSTPTAQTEPVHDPSGIVYEAVLSNPVEGATVSLYRYKDSSEPMSLWDDSDYLKQDNPVMTDENGYYRWDVPEGEWYVTAEKKGYEQGSSQNDKEAVKKHGNVNYLPVLPPQLDVNIPLVSYEPPNVEAVNAKTDGVYITFSKYMNEADLVMSNFTLKDSTGKDISFTVEKLDSEQAPANINYQGEAPSYTRNILLKATLKKDSQVSLRVNGDLRSYSDVYMTAPFETDSIVETKKTLSPPEFSVEEGEIDKGTIVTLTSPDQSDIIYTTDGTIPGENNGTRVKSGTDISLITDTTLKAIAVDTASKTSTITTAVYTLKKTIVDQDDPGTVILLGDADGDGKITVIDVTTIQQYLARLNPENYVEKAADVDGDGNITIIDATIIQQYLAKITIEYKVGEPMA